MRLSLLNPDGTPAMFGDHVGEDVIGPKRIHLMADGDVEEPMLRLNVRSDDSARWWLNCEIVRGIGFRLAKLATLQTRFCVMGHEPIQLPKIPAGKGLVLDLTIGLPENPSFGTVEFGVDALYVEPVIGPERVVWTADPEEPPVTMSPAPEGARWSFGIVPPVARGRTGSITSQTVRVEDEGRCNACTGGSYETVTLVELRSIGFRLCDECRKTLVEQLASEEPEEIDEVHERGYQMGYADAVIDAAAGGLDPEILDAESRRRAGESGADVLKVPRLVDGRVMRGDAEVEPKCPICGTGIVCPCGVGIGT